MRALAQKFSGPIGGVPGWPGWDCGGPPRCRVFSKDELLREVWGLKAPAGVTVLGGASSAARGRAAGPRSRWRSTKTN